MNFSKKFLTESRLFVSRIASYWPNYKFSLLQITLITKFSLLQIAPTFSANIGSRSSVRLDINFFSKFGPIVRFKSHWNRQKWPIPGLNPGFWWWRGILLRVQTFGCQMMASSMRSTHRWSRNGERWIVPENLGSEESLWNTGDEWMDRKFR